MTIHRQWGHNGATNMEITQRMAEFFRVEPREIKFDIKCKDLSADDLAAIEQEMGTRVAGARYQWGLR